MAKRDGIFKRFCRNDRGNIAMMFGLGLVPMLTASGVALDYARLSSARTSLQSALDSGVLAVARDPNVLTQAVILERIAPFIQNNSTGSFPTPPVVTVIPSGPNDVDVEVVGCLQLAFSSFVSVVNPCIKARTKVSRPAQTYLEVALVLDNSGSMSGTKIEAARTAATQFVTSLFAGSTNPDQIKVSVVPFTLTVNAGAGMSTTSNPNLDLNGASPVHWENLLPASTLPPSGVTSRFSLFQQLGETWGGCFEMRPGAWGTNDEAPQVGSPSSLFVPMFAPDEPGTRADTSIRRDLLNDNGGGGNYTPTNSYMNDDGSRTLNYTSGRETSATQSACLASPTSTLFNLPFSAPTANWQDSNWRFRSSSNICRYNLTGTPGGTTNRKSIANTGGVSNGAGRGPNYACNAIPLQRMTNNSATVISKINAMRADGNTNILEGFMWGWRTVSPNAPYADGRAYNWNGGQIRNKKIIVVMTDGDNFWNQASNPNLSIYSPFGYYRNNRIGTNITNAVQATAAMNARTLQACTNAKATRNINNDEGIQIYTVGFSTPGAEISPAGLQLLQDCASVENGNRLYYSATNAGELASVFATIANNIGQLKITQ